MHAAMTRLLNTFILTTLVSCLTQSQTLQTGNQRQPNFANQGEQEDYWAALLFQNEYSRQRFEKFKGTIKVNGDSLSYLNQTMVVTNTDQRWAAVFTNGLFHPGMIKGQVKVIGKNDQGLNTPASFTISNFEELPFLSKNVRQKRFRFWLFINGFCNPVVCFIELTNDKANDKTDTETFIKAATLTFFRNAWPVI